MEDKFKSQTIAGPTAQASQTVHYSGAGSKTPSDNVQTFNFTSTENQQTDLFTGDVTTADPNWSAAQQSVSVPTPNILGYTPDLSEIPADSYDNTTGDQTFNVNYTPDPASLKIVYQDVEAGGTQVLGTQVLNGVTDGAYDNTSAYASELASLSQKGYILTSGVPTKGKFDAGDQTEIVNLQVDESKLAIPKAALTTEQSTYQVGQPVTATFNQPVNDLSQFYGYRYSNWDTTLTIPSDVQNATVQLKDDKGNLVPTTIVTLPNGQAKVSVSSATMKSLPFTGGNLSFCHFGSIKCSACGWNGIKLQCRYPNRGTQFISCLSNAANCS